MADRQTLMRLQNEALDILGELSEIIPDSYRLTLVARDCSADGDGDIVLTNDVHDDVISALGRSRDKMEGA